MDRAFGLPSLESVPSGDLFNFDSFRNMTLEMPYFPTKHQRQQPAQLSVRCATLSNKIVFGTGYAKVMGMRIFLDS